MPCGPWNCDGGSFFQIAQPVRQEAIFHAIQAKIKPGTSARRRGDRVGASVGLAVGLRLLDRDELAGSKVKFGSPFDRELEMLGLIGQKDAIGQAGGQELALAGLTDGRVRDLLRKCGTYNGLRSLTIIR